jgi:hypothetical protein
LPFVLKISAKESAKKFTREQILGDEDIQDIIYQNIKKGDKMQALFGIIPREISGFIKIQKKFGK